jgi:hypothetical protein
VVLEKNHTIKGRTLCVRKAVPKEQMMEQQQDLKNNHKNISRSSFIQAGPIHSIRQ